MWVPKINFSGFWFLIGLGSALLESKKTNKVRHVMGALIMTKKLVGLCSVLDMRLSYFILRAYGKIFWHLWNWVRGLAFEDSTANIRIHCLILALKLNYGWSLDFYLCNYNLRGGGYPYKCLQQIGNAGNQFLNLWAIYQELYIKFKCQTTITNTRCNYTKQIGEMFHFSDSPESFLVKFVASRGFYWFLPSNIWQETVLPRKTKFWV